MELIMRTDVPGVGKRGDLVEVADGFARNFLLPKGHAFKATSGAHAQAEAMRRTRDISDAAARSAAEEIAKTLVPATITVTAKTGGGERLFGSVTTSDIVEAILAQTGLEVDRHALHLDEPIKSLGTHSVPAKLHHDVEFPVTVEVISA
jgi:large subunit ribosomal protein L9